MQPHLAGCCFRSCCDYPDLSRNCYSARREQDPNDSSGNQNLIFSSSGSKRYHLQSGLLQSSDHYLFKKPFIFIGTGSAQLPGQERRRYSQRGAEKRPYCFSPADGCGTRLSSTRYPLNPLFFRCCSTAFGHDFLTFSLSACLNW